MKTEHVRSSVPTSCRLKVAQSLHSVRLALEVKVSTVEVKPSQNESDCRDAKASTTVTDIVHAQVASSQHRLSVSSMPSQGVC